MTRALCLVLVAAVRPKCTIDNRGCSLKGGAQSIAATPARKFDFIAISPVSFTVVAVLGDFPKEGYADRFGKINASKCL